MRLTGAQVKAIAEVSDGANVTLSPLSGLPGERGIIKVHRLEDDLIVRVEGDGTMSTLKGHDAAQARGDK